MIYFVSSLRRLSHHQQTSGRPKVTFLQGQRHRPENEASSDSDIEIVGAHPGTEDVLEVSSEDETVGSSHVRKYVVIWHIHKMEDN